MRVWVGVCGCGWVYVGVGGCVGFLGEWGWGWVCGCLWVRSRQAV